MVKTNKKAKADVVAQAKKALARQERKLAELAKRHPEFAAYWSASAGMSVLRSVAAGNVAVVVADEVTP